MSSTTPDIGVLVEHAYTAMAANDLATALSALLEAWCAKPAAALAEAIEKVGARAARGCARPDGRDDDARQEAWQAAAETGDPVVRHLLIETINEGYQFAARVRLLAQHRDPRLAARAMTELEACRYHGTHNVAGFWSPLFKALVACADPRMVPRANALVKVHEDQLRGRLHQKEPKAALARVTKFAQQLAAAADRAPTLPAAIAERVAAIVALAGAPDSNAAADADTERALLAAIYAAPADDGPRAIYSDWLLERGDPRGEYIALELAGQDEGRAYHLLRERERQWLGPLAGDAEDHPMTFERGFPAEVSVRRPEGTQRPISDPAWATVHTVRNAIPATDEQPMPILRIARSLDPTEIEYLAKLKRPPPLEELGVRCIDWSSQRGYSVETRRAIAAFARLELPSLSKLVFDGSRVWVTDEMRPDQLEWAWQRFPLAELEVTAHVSQLGAWVRVLESSSIRQFALVHDDYPSSRFELSRDERGKLSVLAMKSTSYHLPRFYVLGSFATSLAQMPADQLTSLSLRVHTSTWNLENRERLAHALAHHPSLKQLDVPGYTAPKRRAAK